MGNVVVGLTLSLDGFIAGRNDGPGNPLGDGGSRLFDWWTAGSERIGGDDRFRPPARSRPVVEEMVDCGAIITGRRTFDIAGGWGGHHPIGAPFFLLTHRSVDQHVGPGTEGTLVSDGIRLFANLDGHRFALDCTRVVESDGVTHIRYRVLK